MVGLTSCWCELCSSRHSPQEKRCGPRRESLQKVRRSGSQHVAALSSSNFTSLLSVFNRPSENPTVHPTDDYNTTINTRTNMWLLTTLLLEQCVWVFFFFGSWVIIDEVKRPMWPKFIFNASLATNTNKPQVPRTEVAFVVMKT